MCSDNLIGTSLMQSKNSDVLTFMQGDKLYYLAAENLAVRISLRESKAEGRHSIITYAALHSKSFLTYSSDYCLSMVPFHQEDRTFGKSCYIAFMCPYCGELFSDSSKLHKQHLHLHKGPVDCPVCGQIELDLFNFRHHKKNCSYTCNHCGKKFVSQTRFNIHMRVHAEFTRTIKRKDTVLMEEEMEFVDVKEENNDNI